jgi:exonuclease VII large subunit
MAKQKQTDALEEGGPGVGIVKDSKLNALADEFVELRDEKAKMAEQMTAIEAKILDRMQEKGIKVFRYADKQVSIKDGKAHVKIKQVKVDGEPSGDDTEN